MADTMKAKEMCRKCAKNWKCDIRGVIEFYQPIEQNHPDPDYTLENIFKAGTGECPFFEVFDGDKYINYKNEGLRYCPADKNIYWGL